MSPLRDKVARLARLGVSDIEIAETLGINRRTACRHRVEAGMGRPRRVVSEEDERIIDALADDGASVAEIARTVGVSWPTVGKRRPDAVWSAKDVTTWAAMHRRRDGKR